MVCLLALVTVGNLTASTLLARLQTLMAAEAVHGHKRLRATLSIRSIDGWTFTIMNHKLSELFRPRPKVRALSSSPLNGSHTHKRRGNH